MKTNKIVLYLNDVSNLVVLASNSVISSLVFLLQVNKKKPRYPNAGVGMLTKPISDMFASPSQTLRVDSFASQKDQVSYLWGR